MPDIETVRDLNYLFNKVYSISVYVDSLDCDQTQKDFIQMKINSCCADLTEMQKQIVQQIDGGCECQKNVLEKE